FFFQAEDGIRDFHVTGVQTCALPISSAFGEPALLQKVLEAHGPDRVLVSVDVRGGRVATAGWTEQGALDALGALERLQRDGVERSEERRVGKERRRGGRSCARARTSA